MSSRRPAIVYGESPASRSSAYRPSSRDSYDSGYTSGGGYNAQNYTSTGRGASGGSYAQSYSSQDPITTWNASGSHHHPALLTRTKANVWSAARSASEQSSSKNKARSSNASSWESSTKSHAYASTPAAKSTHAYEGSSRAKSSSKTNPVVSYGR